MSFPNTILEKATRFNARQFRSGVPDFTNADCPCGQRAQTIQVIDGAEHAFCLQHRPGRRDNPAMITTRLMRSAIVRAELRGL